MSNSVECLIQSAEHSLASYWVELEARCHTNTARILDSFAEFGLSDVHFTSVTGYGHNDLGREVTDQIFARVFGAQAALVRLQFVSGTHAISAALKGALGCAARQTLVAVTGAPYDTLEEVIGTRGDSSQSLMALGASYHEINLLDQGHLRLNASPGETETLRSAGVFFIQRSRGYSLRPSLSQEDLKTLIAFLKGLNPTALIVVDNCYGEFVYTEEPPVWGADLIAGSLIKNPGGGIVTTGGYVAGNTTLVEAAADSLTAPGIGSHGGYTFEGTRTLLQGLYLAPTTVMNALKGMRLSAQVFSQLGYQVNPSPVETQADIIQAITLGVPEKVLHFCRALQSVSPVDSRLTPIPAVTPGYADPVVMAGGTFIFGSTIELSADAPMREPYTVFFQGGLTYSHTRYALQRILEQLL